jgi:hypothetical protein
MSLVSSASTFTGHSIEHGGNGARVLNTSNEGIPVTRIALQPSRFRATRTAPDAAEVPSSSETKFRGLDQVGARVGAVRSRSVGGVVERDALRRERFGRARSVCPTPESRRSGGIPPILGR